MCGRSGPPPGGDVTFSLAIAAARKSAVEHARSFSPLRRFRLIELEPGHGVTAAPLRIDERILHYLAGVNQLDQRLEVRSVRKSQSGRLAEAHDGGPGNPARFDHRAASTGPVLHLCGDDVAGPGRRRGLAWPTAAGRHLFVLRPRTPRPRAPSWQQFYSSVEREALLSAGVSVVAVGPDEAPSAPARRTGREIAGALMIASRDPIRLHRAVLRYEVNRPYPAGRRRLWQEALGPAASEMPRLLESTVAEQFRLSAETIVSIARLAGPA